MILPPKGYFTNEAGDLILIDGEEMRAALPSPTGGSIKLTQKLLSLFPTPITMRHWRPRKILDGTGFIIEHNRKQYYRRHVSGTERLMTELIALEHQLQLMTICEEIYYDYKKRQRDVAYRR